ncbi:nucleoside hydrolase [Devosia sp. SL43]|uniref:nucleoside hydrolase n=1 Tax=Devosia sp. SL43 TaxID=2806348 RepID=UPI001F35E0A8|nr:nucleoside hydrolase [Devosia sp. SL43]UJW86173.1 nucleoside hydrolase [Devosia sp. SL43]
MNRRVVIDTDPGLDDAVAILFALNSGRFDVLGITTVAGNIGLERTTRNAGGLLAQLSLSDIPVISGSSEAMLRTNIDALVIHGSDGLRGVTFPEPLTPPRTGAVAWLAETLVNAPSGSIDILALGPLTNIGRLINEYPEAAARIGRVICMGGTIHEPGNAGPGSEFNFASDPEATAIVLHAAIKCVVIPLDVTRKVRASAAYVEALRVTQAGTVAADLLLAYMQDGKQSRPLHDPCVMLLALAPELFDIEMRRLAVDLSDGADAGALLERSTGQPVSIAMRVDADGALDLLASGFR